MISIDTTTVLAIVAIVTTFLSSWFFFVKKAKDTKSLDLETRLISVEKELAVQGVSITIAFQSKLAKELTHLHTPEMDGYLKKLWPYTLTAEEKERLWVLLEARVTEFDDRIDISEREAARMLPFVINRIERETLKERERNKK